MPSCLQRPGLETTECDEVRAGGSYSSWCVQYMLVKCQRTVQHHAQNFQFIGRSYSAASDDDRLWQLWHTQSLLTALLYTTRHLGRLHSLRALTMYLYQQL